MTKELLSQNLIRLRNEKSLSQEQVAQKAGLSRSAYSNIEAGRTKPRNSTVLALADALKVSIEEFYKNISIGSEGIRFRSTRQLKARSDIIADTRSRLLQFGELEKLLGPGMTADFETQFPPDEFAGMDPRDAAQKARTRLKLYEQPIRNIYSLLETKCGVMVLARPVASPHFFGLSVAPGFGGPAIVVNTWERITVERWIFTAAHELGHLVLHRDSFALDTEEEDKKQEKEANLFASHFLMPCEAFEREWKHTEGLGLLERVQKVKRVFGVSHMTVLYRLTTEMGYGQQLWNAYKSIYKATHNRELEIHEESGPTMGWEEFCDSRWQDYGNFVEPHKANEKEALPPNDFYGRRLENMVLQAVISEHIPLEEGAAILQIDHKEMFERCMAAIPLPALVHDF